MEIIRLISNTSIIVAFILLIGLTIAMLRDKGRIVVAICICICILLGLAMIPRLVYYLQNWLHIVL